ncbi:MAG: hypothetical protein H5T92_04430 [Synergistales bacterium]|nr:hypothetical protein [Synergistales bacterium]
MQITLNKGATSAFEVTPDRMNTQDGHWYVYHFGGREEAQFLAEGICESVLEACRYPELAVEGSDYSAAF